MGRMVSPGRWMLTAAVAACLPALSVRAQQTLPEGAKPMVVTVYRDAIPGCEPNCITWISAEGRIMADTPAQFAKVLKAVGNRKVPVLINSPGGELRSAVAISKMIRDRKLDVIVARSRCRVP